jgi:hypothetical protein
MKLRFHAVPFDHLSFLFGADLLQSIHVPGQLERTGLYDKRPSDIPSYLGGDGKVHAYSMWTGIYSTPAEHQQWKRGGSNVVLHTRNTYGLRVSLDAVTEFIELTQVEPMVVREGERNSVVLLFKVVFSKSSPSDGTDTGPIEVPTLSPRVLAEKYSRVGAAKLIAMSADPIEFLGEGCTVLVHGKAANGSAVRFHGHRLVQVPVITLDSLERFWRSLADRFGIKGDGHRPAPPLMDLKDRLGRFVYPVLLQKLPPAARDFLQWLAGHGRLLSFNGAESVQVLCPWHPNIRTIASHRPARFDLATGEMSCSHATCQRMNRTRIDFEMRYGFRIL